MEALSTGVSIPEENQIAFEKLFILENTLREFIIEQLTSLAGPFWYKGRLRGEAVDKYKRAISVQRKTRWTALIPHHPLYYIDFSELRETIIRNDNWADVFQSALSSRKDLVAATLSEIEPIRNEVAHNRHLSRLQLDTLSVALEKVLEILGPENVAKYSRKRTVALTIPAQLQHLSEEAESSFSTCRNCEALSNLRVWGQTKGQWWFDSEYLGHDISSIIVYFGLMEEYAQLPRTRGEGHKIEKWAKEKDIAQNYSNVNKMMTALLPHPKGPDL